jgi:hypothetical protein
MQIITIGRRLVPSNQIAVVEPFDPLTNPEFKPEKTFQARIVLLNRDTILTETSMHEFAKANGFHLLGNENIAVNPNLPFGSRDIHGLGKLQTTEALSVPH